MTAPAPSADAARWLLDPEVLYLNHGSFGACPREVLAAQTTWRERMEREPIRFFADALEKLLDGVRGSLSELVGVQAEDLALIGNATAGVNTVLRALSFSPGDEILITDHGYNACSNAAEAVAQSTGAKVVKVKLPFPVASAADLEAPILAAVGPRTRLALLDHITAPTGLVMPLERLVPALKARGVETLVDGAHAPGMVPLQIDALGAGYYTGNCHKWLCAPKGAAFLHVRRDLQAAMRPLSVSHGWNSPRKDRSRFRLNFDWQGTLDPSPWLCVPDAIRFLSSLRLGGLPALMAENRQKALAGRETLCRALGLTPPAPDALIGALVALPLLPARPEAVVEGQWWDPLSAQLREQHRIEVPVWPFPAPPRRVVRISAQAYNAPWQYERLGAALKTLLGQA